MRRRTTSLLFGLTLMLLGRGLSVDASSSLAASVPNDQLHAVEWRLDPEDIKVEGQAMSVLSVSPSGQYIAAANRLTQNRDKMNAEGIANPFGRFPDAVYLFARDGEHYRLAETIPVDTQTQPELSSILGGGSEFAWNDEETRIVITGDWGMTSESKNYMMNSHTNLYLLEIAEGTFRRLTQNDSECEHSVLAQWNGADSVRYVSSHLTDENMWENALCEIDLETGAESRIADLYSAEGRVCPVLSWQIAGEQIYYTVDAFSAQTGFFRTPIGGSAADAGSLLNMLSGLVKSAGGISTANAECLLDITAELRETNRHPYCSAVELCQPGISPDGRWACLIGLDQRIFRRDIPLSDDPQHPQSDPSNAVSVVDGRPWVPCHDIFLYNLEEERLVDPFVDEALDPAKVIVTGACFSPDGKSLLCAVFGDGGPWTLGDYNRVTFYRIDLTDENFTAERVFETELESGHWFYDGFRWLDDNVLCLPTGQPPLYFINMIRPESVG